VDLLKFFLRGEGYRADVEHLTGSRSFSYLSPFELKAAINALLKRGFLFTATTGNGHAPASSNGHRASYPVPCELRDLLPALIWDDDRTVDETFTLRGHLARLVERKDLDALLRSHLGGGPGAADHGEAAALLATPAAVAKRLAAVENPKHTELLAIVVQSYGGVASRSVLEKSHRGLGRWNRKALQEALESQLLGTVRHVALGEYGIHQFDEVVVVFAELVDAARAALQKDSPRLDKIQSLGVDLSSDIPA